MNWTNEKLSLNTNSKGLKITDLYKNVYSSQIGDAINKLKKQTRILKEARFSKTIRVKDNM